MAKPEEQPSARRSISTYCAERADCANGCCAIWSWFVGTWRAAPICPQSRRLKGEEALCLIAEDLAALEQAANVCERRVMEQEKVPMAEKIISLSDSDASFIVKGGWNTVVGYRPQLARSGGGFVTGLVLPRGNAAACNARGAASSYPPARLPNPHGRKTALRICYSLLRRD